MEKCLECKKEYESAIMKDGFAPDMVSEDEFVCWSDEHVFIHSL
jgi:hypothetical protein